MNTTFAETIPEGLRASSPYRPVAVHMARSNQALDYVCAAELPDNPEPVDQLVEGVIGRVALSMLFGDTNCGKTFYAIGLGNAVAQGARFMGRRTVKGLVIYLATEAPASVIRRQQAYQRHFGVKVGGMVIVKSPINLFDGTADAAEVINLIREIELREGIKAELVIGDTLSRLAAGANENAGEDMGAVIAHAEYIKREAQVHVLLIHHCGKDQARGARGWSGLRAAIDTEIEVTSDEATGNRVAEITKQRDLGGKGDRIGFRLEVVDLGPGQWDTRQTSCVVVPADAPAKATKGKRLSDIAGSIIEHLTARGTGMKKADLARHFEDRYPSSSVYRELKRLVDDGRVHESAGIVVLAGKAK